MVVKMDEVVMPNRERILQMAGLYGAHRVRVFGSVARRQDDVDSDIDFLVDMEPGRSLLDLGGLLIDLVLSSFSKSIRGLLRIFTINKKHPASFCYNVEVKNNRTERKSK